VPSAVVVVLLAVADHHACLRELPEHVDVQALVPNAAVERLDLVEHRGNTCAIRSRGEHHRIRDLARNIENELGSLFEPYGATLRVLPIRISHVREVGEGVQLDLELESE